MRENEFFSSVRRHLDETLATLGLHWESSEMQRVRYRSADIRVDVWHEITDHSVVTKVWVLIDGTYTSAHLDRLYWAAGFGPLQDVKEGAQTRHALDKSLVSQAAALQSVIPLLTSSDSAQLVSKAQ